MDEEVTKRSVLKTAAGIGAFGLVPGSGRGADDPPEDRDRYIVGVTSGDEDRTSTAVEAAKREAIAVHTEIELPGVRHLVVGEYATADVESIRSTPGVAYVEPDRRYRLPQPIVHPNRSDGEQPGASDAGAAVDDHEYPWGIERLDATTLRDLGYTGDGATIAILDSGIDPTHPALGDTIDGGTSIGGACREDRGPYDDVDCAEDWDDSYGHGTHVAGSAGALDHDVDEAENPGAGIDRIAGVAPAASLLAVNVLHWRESDNGWTDFVWASDFIDGLNWAVSEGADVVNASLVGFDPYDPMRDAVASATDSGVVVVVSAGNTGGEGCDDDCVSYPAAYDDAIAVAATTEDDSVAYFSSRGPEVDVAAPGASVTSSVPAIGDAYDGRYAVFSGTSMAAPHVSGLAALLKAHTGLEDPGAIRDRMQETAADIGGDEVETGAGLIDPVGAVEVDLTPALGTDDATDVGATTATVSGRLDDLADTETVAVGFEYGPAGGALDQSVEVGTRSEPGSFSATLTDLDDGLEYEVRAVGRPEAADTVATGETATFTTTSLAAPYTNEDGIVETAGLRTAVQDWQRGDIGTERLRSTLEAWSLGEPVPT